MSILEAFTAVEELTGRAMRWRYMDQPRRGDHICYISNLNRLRSALPNWHITKSLDQIFAELVDGWRERQVDFE